MSPFKLAVVLVLVTALLPVVFAQLELVNSWKYLNFDFRTEAERTAYITNKYFQNCTIAGIKLDSSGNIYVSIPRWRANVPVTLARVNNDTNTLEAFPSWEMNNPLDKDSALQSVLGFEIDSQDRMWILDQGRVDNVPGVAKLVVWDLKKNESIKVHAFNETIAPPQTAFLNDVVVNGEDNIAYISDSGIPVTEGAKPKPALIMYDLDDDSEKRVLEDVPSTQVDSNVWLNVNGKKCFNDKPMQTGMDGIALSCDNQRLYWTPLTSRRLYAMETDILLMYDADDPIVNASVVDLGFKKSSSDGFIASSQRELFLTALETNAIYQLNERQIISNIQSLVSPPELILTTLVNDSKLIWPDTMAIQDGYLYVVSNNLCAFLQNELKFDVDNFFIYKIALPSGAGPYSSGCDAAAVNFGPVEIALMSSGAALFVASIVIVLIISIRRKKEGHYDSLN